MIQISGSMSGMVRRRHRRMEWYVDVIIILIVVVVVWISIIGSGYTLDGGIVQWCKRPCRCRRCGRCCG